VIDALLDAAVDPSGDERPRPGPATMVPGRTTPASVAKAAAIASGERHVVASIRFGVGRVTECACGATFAGKTDGQMAYDYGEHRRGVGSGS